VVGQNVVRGFDPARLRSARRDAGLSQRELGQRIGVPTTTVTKWETGDRVPYVDKLTLLARALGITPAALTTHDAAGGTLAQLRINAGLTQQAAAARAGLVRTRYSAIERGEIATVDADVIGQIATALDVTAAQVSRAHALARSVYLAGRR
jgi:transcriptional regulator with XRE-family HTH domain